MSQGRFYNGRTISCPGPSDNARRIGATSSLNQPCMCGSHGRLLMFLGLWIQCQSGSPCTVDLRALLSWPFFLHPCPQAIYRLLAARTTIGYPLYSSPSPIFTPSFALLPQVYCPSLLSTRDGKEQRSGPSVLQLPCVDVDDLARHHRG